VTATPAGVDASPQSGRRQCAIVALARTPQAFGDTLRTQSCPFFLQLLASRLPTLLPGRGRVGDGDGDGDGDGAARHTVC